MRVSHPKDLSGFTIPQIQDVIKLMKDNGVNEDMRMIEVDLMAEFVSIFTGVPYEDVLDFRQLDIKRIFEGGLKSFTTYKTKEPPKTINVNGKVYNFVDPKKQKGGWYVDVKTMAAEFEINPELLPALNYVEKGMKYGEKDKDGFMINPTRDRAAWFRDYFPGDVFLDLNAFF